MRKNGRVVSGLLTFCLLATQASPASAKVSLTVDPLVAEFNVPPGSAGHATVHVSNTGSSPQVITARRLDWRTVADGSITLEKVGAEGAHSITRDLSLSTYRFILAPGERRDVSLTLTVPPTLQPAPASYWGGFIFDSSDVSSSRGEVGVAATVFVYENVNSPSKHVTLQALRVRTQHGGKSTLVARLRNTGASYIRPIAKLMIGQGGRVVRSDSVTVNTVFPNSTRIVSQDIGHLPPGEYTAELTIDYGGNSILDGITKFVIH